ncbi:MAG: GTP-binding protein [Clostridia bacterium]|jgi:bifunctional enzyme CysN/CysC|nr:GTP-binding protein [Clostridiaceae bacterium]
MSLIKETLKAEVSQREFMNIVIVGHVDHGKSTVIGRLLADTDSLPEGKLEQVRENCRRNSKPFEYAFLLDALKDERSQGITIDAARCFFKSKKRNYLILDAPGHVEFLKNMVTGASNAEAALLVIDAKEGIMENSTRHGYLLSMLGIRQIAVLVNKMDLVDYDRSVYEDIKKNYSDFLEKIGIKASCFIPVSGFQGDNITERSENMPWYDGDTVLERLDLFETAGLPIDMPFRMPVQGVYKFTQDGDDRRIVAGTVETGKLKVGDTVIFYPSGKKSKVKTIEAFNAPAPEICIPGMATGFTLEDQIYITRGEIATKAGEPPCRIGRKIVANVFWLGKNSLVKNKEYHIKIGTAKASVRLDKVVKVLNASDLSDKTKDYVERHEVAECIFELAKDIAFDFNHENPVTGRFVIVDEYEIAGGGIIVDQVKDKYSKVRDYVVMRNIKWEKSIIGRDLRSIRYKQKPALVIITGKEEADKKELAREVEKLLFDNGEFVYFLGIGNVVYGVDADLKAKQQDRSLKDPNRLEHIRRLGEVANLLLDAGMILVVTAVELTAEEIDLIDTTVIPPHICVVWLGDEVTTDIKYDLKLSEGDYRKNAAIIRKHLCERGVLFNPSM